MRKAQQQMTGCALIGVTSKCLCHHTFVPNDRRDIQHFADLRILPWQYPTRAKKASALHSAHPPIPICRRKSAMFQ
jgi:hypothetical protein